MARDAAVFRFVVVVAEEDDAVNDPTLAWPAERETVEVGRLGSRGPSWSASRATTSWSSTPPA